MQSKGLTEKLTLLIVVFVCAAVAMPRLLHPSLHMDESYYLGAAKAIAEGDFFLQTIGLDKSFLTAWILIPGMLIFGENALGYHSIHYIFYLATVALIFGLVLEQMHESSRVLKLVFSAISALVFGLHPWSIAFMPGAFSEGFFLFLVVYYFKTLLAQQQEMTLRTHGIFLLLLFCTKQTAVLLFPIPLMILMHRNLDMLRTSEHSPSRRAKHWALTCLKDIASVFHSSRSIQVLCGVFLLYSLFGQTKFEAILFLFGAGLGHTKSQTEIFLNFLQGWSGWLGSLGAWSDGLIAILLLSSLVLGFVFVLQRWRTAPILLAVWLSFLLHFFMVAHDSRQFGRYYLYLWIHLLTLILILPSTLGQWKNFRPFLLGMFWLTVVYNPLLWSKELPVKEWAYELEKVREILPRDGVLHESSLNWYLRPYRQEEIPLRTRDLSRELILEERIGQPGPFFQYALNGKPDKEAAPRLVAVEEVYLDLGTPIRQDRLEGVNSGLSATIFKSQFRLGNWETLSYQSLPGGLLELVAGRETRFGLVTASIRGKVFLSNGRLAEMELGHGRTLLTLELVSMDLQIQGSPSVSVMPIATVLYRSRFFPLGPVGLLLQGPADVAVESIDPQSGRYVLQVMQRLQNPVYW